MILPPPIYWLYIYESTRTHKYIVSLTLVPRQHKVSQWSEVKWSRVTVTAAYAMSCCHCQNMSLSAYLMDASDYQDEAQKTTTCRKKVATTRGEIWCGAPKCQNKLTACCLPLLYLVLLLFKVLLGGGISAPLWVTTCIFTYTNAHIVHTHMHAVHIGCVIVCASSYCRRFNLYSKHINVNAHTYSYLFMRVCLSTLI